MRPHIVTPLPGPNATAMLARDRAVVSTNYVRPYPLVPSHGEGAWITDVDGNRFLDCMAGIAVNTTGYNHPRVVEAVSAQAAKFSHVCFSDFTHDPVLTLAERLVDRLGGGYRVFFGNSGTEGLEAALKLVRYYTKRPYAIAFTGSFHGRSTGALSLTASNSKYRKGFGPFIGGAAHIPYPNPFRPVFGSTPETVGEAVLEHLEHLLRTTTPPEEVGAIYFEPIQGEGGYVVPPKGFLPALADIAKRHGMLLVADEVQSGVGRTGTFFAFEQEGISPDIVVLAKGLASGYPICATLFRQELSTWGPGAHGSTFGGNPVSAAAALATLDLVEGELMTNAQRVGDHLMARLRGLQARFPRLGEVRGRGLMVGLDFVTDPQSRQEDPVLRDAVQQRAFERGLLVLGAGPSTIRLAPPLILSHAEADVAVDVLTDVLSELLGDGPTTSASHTRSEPALV
jgi:4-aminobutyrate aminotransferase